jgi:branched-chain amino acid transport system substrate-binding protein
LRVHLVAAAGCLSAALAFGVAGCGGGSSKDGDDGGNQVGSTSLTIYSSVPMHGDSHGTSVAIVNGEKMALARQHAKVGKFTINFVNLDDSSSDAGKWEPNATSVDARKAAQDQSTIGYLGDSNSGASAISIPILNEAGILQVSPSNTTVGLTRSQDADKGEPDKYYPSAKRTYGRVVPADQIQSAAQVTYQKDNGCTKTYVLNDKEVYGASLARNVLTAAKAQGLTVLGNVGIDPKAANYRSLATTVKDAGADCVFFSGVTDDNAIQLFKDLHAEMPTAKLFGPDGVAETAFTSRLGADLERSVYITSPTLAPRLYPASGQAFFKDYRAKYGIDPEPYAIFGYEAMAVMLQAIKNAGDKGNDRAAVIAAFFKIKNRNSPLGTYSIDENGDTTLADYGGNRVSRGKLVFDQMLKGKAGS